MTESEDETPMVRQTPLGTVIRSEWNEDYYKRVVKFEQGARRAICGAPKKDGDPCKGRPEEQHHYYCRLHRVTGDMQLSAAEKGIVPQPIPRVPILLNSEVRNMLANCNICAIRNKCDEFIPGHYCVIEERAYHNFVNTAKQDYDVSDLDMYSLIPAAMSFLNIVRVRLAQSRMTPQDAEASRVSWMAPRESKEFIRLMKELGLTRKERLDQQRHRTGTASLPQQTTLAEIMSGLPKGSAEGVTLTQSITVKPKKDEKDEDIIDVKELKPEET